jgi:tetratricopeptide (TPR) repeat protein
MENTKTQRLSQLREGMCIVFSGGEVQTICFDLGIDYDALSGSNKVEKIRELIGYCERRGILEDLEGYCRLERPKYCWPIGHQIEISAQEQRKLRDLMSEFDSIKHDPEVDLQKKILIGEEILGIDPDNSAKFDVAHLFYQWADNHRLAALFFRITLDQGIIKPSDTETWIKHATSERDNCARCIVHLSRCVSLRPRFHQAYEMRGKVHLQLGQFDEATADFSRAIEIFPSNGKYYLWRGRACFNKHMEQLETRTFFQKLFRADLTNLVSAQEDARKAIELGVQPKSGSAYVMMAGLNRVAWKKTKKDDDLYLVLDLLQWSYLEDYQETYGSRATLVTNQIGKSS